MRLAIVAPGHPYRGGIAHFGVRLAQELADQPAGHHCLYINFTRLYPNRLFPGKTQFDDSAAPVGFTSERLIDSIQPLSWRRAGRRIREWGAEAILFHWWHPLFGPCYRGISAAVGKSVIKVAICHNVAPHEKGRPRRSAARYGLRKMDGFVLHARSEINEIEGLLPGSTFVTLFHPIYDIFPGEDVPGEEARRRLNLNPEDKVVLYFGIIRPYKGVETLLEAAGQLSDMDNLKLLVVGEIYKGSDRIYRLVQSLPGRQVRLVNRYIPNEEVALWFRASDIVALPYLSATQSGIVPIAYRCLRPVIVGCGRARGEWIPGRTGRS